jgi:hypothetical protein
VPDSHPYQEHILTIFSLRVSPKRLSPFQYQMAFEK